MATSSFFKKFIITDHEAFEQFKNDTESEMKCNINNIQSTKNSLEYGREKLKEFSFR